MVKLLKTKNMKLVILKLLLVLLSMALVVFGAVVELYRPEYVNRPSYIILLSLLPVVVAINIQARQLNKQKQKTINLF